MCGIVGIISHKGMPFEPGKIKKMCDIISHRGPDDAGYAFFRLGERTTGEGGYWCGFTDPSFRYLNENLPVFGGDYYKEEIVRHPITVGLGHRRLSIIDLTHYGHQPMSSSDRRYWVVFNGEIYNFPELKTELESRGHIFRTRTDTEVLLHLWEEFGIDSIKMLNGMFAFAIYDRVKNKLLLARDRFGVKPLYYVTTEEYLIFGSEIKAILASGLIKPEINPSALVEYMMFQNILCDKTLFKGVNMLPSGCFLQMSPISGREPVLEKYHNGLPSINFEDNEQNEGLLEKVVSGFEEAVRRQLISDVPVGAYLSGGMDSGSIVAVAGRSIPRLMTFTGGFDLTNVNGIEQGFDERPLAEKLSYLLQTEHYAVVLHAGDMPAAMEQITWHVDDPRVGMCHQNWYVAKLASKFVKVCLAGAGGDELFGGYPWRYRHGLIAEDVNDFDDRYFNYWNRLLDPQELRELLSPDLHEYLFSARESFQSVMKDAPKEDLNLSKYHNFLQRALFFEFKTFLHGFLVIEDRVSMAHSLETRVPFLDNDLTDLAWRIYPQFKVDISRIIGDNSGSHLETAEGKIILRQAMERFLPKEFTQQKKQGFSPPDENWFRGPSMDYIKNILLDHVSLQRPYFSEHFVQSCLQEHFSGERNHRLLIWSLLSFEWLQRHFIDKGVN